MDQQCKVMATKPATTVSHTAVLARRIPEQPTHCRHDTAHCAAMARLARVVVGVIAADRAPEDEREKQDERCIENLQLGRAFS